MPRPRKWRRVCSLPENKTFGPLNKAIGDNDYIKMSVEEYETIRLIDFEGLMQEECADRMEVARTTIHRIYTSAREKIAQALVNGQAISIEGGDYILCEERQPSCGNGRCHRHGRNIL